MATAVIVATSVQKIPIKTTIVSGSAERRLVKLFIEGPKAQEEDWFLLSSYLSTAECANIFSIRNSVDDDGTYNQPVLDTWSYTSQDAKIVNEGSTTGKSRVEVVYWTE